ncbi:FAD-dependent pyridine nucleotide-disulfide oxidoreductase [Leptospira ryugenii]|uniref:FAD-dependent pyridine nucleotide-disulfide oxidoreductase n=1 Tax=Leptospira ryugenii TaxID=1917863 RepID=A0A2P2DYE5_9LEPT|nr:FAD-dependent oxidoreductase [Leptospira ryugenii]GBF49651.1 FAD-dependent pyridine nucleotide-disulfide oxidoreductase [Leptospira ryugenii]
MAKEYQLPKTIAIIGASFSGAIAAKRIRELDARARIVLLEKGNEVSYSLSGLPYFLSGEVKSIDQLKKEDENYLKKFFNIEVYTQTKANAVDTKTKTIFTTSEEDLTELKYDELIVATGAASLYPDGLHSEIKNHFFLRNIQDTLQIDRLFRSAQKRILVLGAGSAGMEAVDACYKRGVEAILIEKEEKILPMFGETITCLVENQISGKVKVFKNTKHITFESNENQITSATWNNQKMPIDGVISCIGIRPRTELSKSIGLKLWQDGTIKIDDHCKTNIKNVFACGLAASVPTRDGYHWLKQSNISSHTALVAAENASGLSSRLGKMAHSTTLRVFGVEFGQIGLSWKDAEQSYGKEKIARIFHWSRDREEFLSDGNRIANELIYLKKNQKILGYETLGNNTKLRLDAFSIVLQEEFTLSDLKYAAFPYFPSAGESKDAINSLASLAIEKEEHRLDLTEPKVILLNRKDYFLLQVDEEELQSIDIDAHFPIGLIRTNLPELLQKFSRSGAKKIATICKDGKTARLAFLVLKDHNIASTAVLGGSLLYQEFSKQSVLS